MFNYISVLNILYFCLRFKRHVAYDSKLMFRFNRKKDIIDELCENWNKDWQKSALSFNFLFAISSFCRHKE